MNLTSIPDRVLHKLDLPNYGPGERCSFGATVTRRHISAVESIMSTSIFIGVKIDPYKCTNLSKITRPAPTPTSTTTGWKEAWKIAQCHTKCAHDTSHPTTTNISKGSIDIEYRSCTCGPDNDPPRYILEHLEHRGQCPNRRDYGC